MAGKGQPKTGGRKPGSRNRDTANLRDMIIQALDKKGGVKYLMQQAEENPVSFMTLVGKVLPLQLTADVNATIAVKHKIVGVKCQK